METKIDSHCRLFNLQLGTAAREGSDSEITGKNLNIRK